MSIFTSTDVNECLSDPCESGSSCTDGVNGYHCECRSGYHGDNCQLGP